MEKIRSEKDLHNEYYSQGKGVVNPFSNMNKQRRPKNLDEIQMKRRSDSPKANERDCNQFSEQLGQFAFTMTEAFCCSLGLNTARSRAPSMISEDAKFRA